MNHSGLEENSPVRAVAAESEEQAIQCLKCPKWWFSTFFTVSEDETVNQFILDEPGIVFESYIEIDFRSPNLARQVHWIRLPDLHIFRQKKGKELERKVMDKFLNRPYVQAINPLSRFSSASDLAKLIADSMPIKQ